MSFEQLLKHLTIFLAVGTNDILYIFWVVFCLTVDIAFDSESKAYLLRFQVNNFFRAIEEILPVLRYTWIMSRHQVYEFDARIKQHEHYDCQRADASWERRYACSSTHIKLGHFKPEQIHPVKSADQSPALPPLVLPFIVCLACKAFLRPMAPSHQLNHLD